MLPQPALLFRAETVEEPAPAFSRLGEDVQALIADPAPLQMRQLTQANGIEPGVDLLQERRVACCDRAVHGIRHDLSRRPNNLALQAELCKQRLHGGILSDDGINAPVRQGFQRLRPAAEEQQIELGITFPQDSGLKGSSTGAHDPIAELGQVRGYVRPCAVVQTGAHLVDGVGELQESGALLADEKARMDISFALLHGSQGGWEVAQTKAHGPPGLRRPESPQIHEQARGPSLGVHDGQRGVAAVDGNNERLPLVGAHPRPATGDLQPFLFGDTAHALVEDLQQRRIALPNGQVPVVLVEQLGGRELVLGEEPDALEMVDAGGRVRGEGPQRAALKRVQNGIVARKGHYGLR